MGRGFCGVRVGKMKGMGGDFLFVLCKNKSKMKKKKRGKVRGGKVKKGGKCVCG